MAELIDGTVSQIIVLGATLLCGFFAALMASTAGEIAAALGSLIGADTALLAVYLARKLWGEPVIQRQLIGSAYCHILMLQHNFTCVFRKRRQWQNPFRPEQTKCQATSVAAARENVTPDLRLQLQTASSRRPCKLQTDSRRPGRHF
jgi:hypothetical protein